MVAAMPVAQPASTGAVARARRRASISRPSQSNEQVAHRDERVHRLRRLVILQPDQLGHQTGDGGSAPAKHDPQSGAGTVQTQTPRTLH